MLPVRRTKPSMAVDSELAKTLNLPRTSPSFVLKQTENDGSLEVIQLREIPADGAIYWVSGTSKLASGRDIPSVLVIAEGGGSLIKPGFNRICSGDVAR